MPGLIEERKQVLARRLTQMRAMDEWHLFQNFVLGLMPHDGYTDVRLSAVRNDFGRDGVALTPDGQKCFVAVSFDSSLKKIRHDANRWTEDPNREDAGVMLFATNDSPQNTKVSKWKAKIKQDYKLELRIFNSETILTTATREGVWRETCARLAIPGYRQGYVKVSPYDGEVVRRALKARPPEWLRERVPLAEWDQLSTTPRSRLIFGKPGSGKTTTIFEQLERARPATVLVVESDLSESAQIEGLLDQAAGGAVIVFDDLHESHEIFVKLCQALRARKRDPEPRVAKQYENVVLLAAARSQEWQEIGHDLPLTVRQDLGLYTDAEWKLSDLDVDRCRRLIEICRDEWKLVIEDRLLKQAAQAAAERDATPLFVISMLAAARRREDLSLRDEHLAGLPQNVRDLWKDYWAGLDATSQGVLRLVRLFWAAYTPPQPHLLSAAAKPQFFNIPPSDLANRLDALERSLWLTRTAGVPACLDVQLEVIDLDGAWYEQWDKFVFDGDVAIETRLGLHNGTGVFYAQDLAPRESSRVPYRRCFVAAARHFEVVGTLGRGRADDSLAALALNNASSVYGELAGLETTPERRRTWNEKGVQAVEDSVSIYRELGARAGVARSLHSAYGHYSALAALETTREGWRPWLQKAVDAVEESVAICRELGARRQLAASLRGAAGYYAVRASLESKLEDVSAWLEKAASAVEESVALHRDIGELRSLAGSLNNASVTYNMLAGAVTTPERRRKSCETAVEAVEEAIPILRGLGARADLATSLNNSSDWHRALAALEATRERRREGLEKAAGAAEASVAIYRELGMNGKLAMSLGTLCRCQRGLAEVEVDPAEGARRLELSCEASDEALVLLRSAGDTGPLLGALRDAVTARLPSAQSAVGIDVAQVMPLVDEGLALATSMDVEQALNFFTEIKRKLTEGSE